MTAVAWNERAVASNNRFTEVLELAGFDGTNQGFSRNREKNLANRWCEPACANPAILV